MVEMLLWTMIIFLTFERLNIFLKLPSKIISKSIIASKYACAFQLLIINRSLKAPTWRPFTLFHYTKPQPLKSSATTPVVSTETAPETQSEALEIVHNVKFLFSLLRLSFFFAYEDFLMQFFVLVRKFQVYSPGFFVK